MRTKIITFAVLTLLLPIFSNCSAQEKTEEQNAKSVIEKRPEAPEINTQYGWLNTDKPLTIKDLRGKIILLDFWTFGCINCQHVIPDLKKLEQEYANELVVIGVHSAKFTSEKDEQRIRQAILKFGIEHPVVNDADFQVWQSYGINAWPTVVLIDPEGKIVGKRSGEGFYDIIKVNIDKIIKEQGEKINREPIAFQLEKQQEQKSFLRFPSKMVLDEEGNIYFSDSGNNRILKINEKGEILLVIGKGEEGFQDGTLQEATFYEPHGLALKNNMLYIADTKNNAIRIADLQNNTVKTVAGNGKMGYYYFDEKWEVPILPNSPWDLLIEGDKMFIANAGNHQILQMNLQTNEVFRFAGSGREALTDGNFKEAAFNQPSGLTQIGETLYVADSEASAIRSINLQNNTITTPLGKGLFDFGDKDGTTEQALLQHCVGVEAYEGKIYIADTYNGKIKVLDLEKMRVNTLIAGLSEPNDLLFRKGELWISDTNNHQIVKINLENSQKTIINIQQ